MPIFEYECTSCGVRFERLVSRSEADAVSCVSCRSTETKRLLSVFGVGRVSPSASCDMGRELGCAGACDGGDGAPQCPGGMCPGLAGL